MGAVSRRLKKYGAVYWSGEVFRKNGDIAVFAFDFRELGGGFSVHLYDNPESKLPLVARGENPLVAFESLQDRLSPDVWEALQGLHEELKEFPAW
jgi:hypothetical protein